MNWMLYFVVGAILAHAFMREGVENRSAAVTFFLWPLVMLAGFFPIKEDSE